MKPVDGQLPYSDEAERSLLCTLLNGAQDASTIYDMLTPNDFYMNRYAMIYEACRYIHKQFVTVSVTVVLEYLRRINRLEAVGGASEVYNLIALNVPDFEALPLAGYIQALAYRLRVIRMADEIRRLAAGEDVLASELEGKVLECVQSAGTLATDERIVTAREAVLKLTDQVENRGDSLYTGVATGYTRLDEMLDGVQGLCIVGARPGMGKSAFLIGAALSAAKRGIGVYFWSGEMSAQQQFMRMQAHESGISSRLLRRGLYQPQGVTQDAYAHRVLPAFATLSELPIMIDETPGITPAKLSASIRRVQQQRNLRIGLIIVDYLQLMEADGRHTARYGEVTEISRKLKQLSMAFHAPVMAAAQLNRETENGAKHRPTLAHLRDSGAIEQDADSVVMLYREAVYDPYTIDPESAEFLVVKNRDGDIGTIPMRWKAGLTRFENAPAVRPHAFSNPIARRND
jgi:replicative DNA helicase